MNTNLIKIPFLTLILSLSTTTVVADDQNNFKLAYAAYQQHISANETEQALVMARDAQKYGTKVFGKSHRNSANLALNYARLLNDTGDHKKARKTLKGKLRILEKHYGDNSPQLVPMIMEEARAASAAAASALDGMTLMALQQRAISSGVDAAELEAAMEASDAKARVVALIAASS